MRIVYTFIRAKLVDSKTYARVSGDPTYRPRNTHQALLIASGEVNISSNGSFNFATDDKTSVWDADIELYDFKLSGKIDFKTRKVTGTYSWSQKYLNKDTEEFVVESDGGTFKGVLTSDAGDCVVDKYHTTGSNEGWFGFIFK